MRPTIKDVAKKAGVSTATVSLVIHKHSRISADTKKKVEKAIKELKYYPSGTARGLVSQKTGNIGFILTDNHFLRTEPFYTKIFLGAEFEAHQNEYYVLLTTVSKDFNVGDPLPRFVRERTVDAIVIAGEVPKKLIEALAEYNYPITFIDYDPDFSDYSVVGSDNTKGGTIATNHLIENGHKNIAFLGGNMSHSSIKERLYGYTLAMENAKLPIKKSQIIIEEKSTDRQSGYSAAEKLLKINKNVTAIFACNDAMAIGAMQFLKDMGKKIPDDISIIGFDDVEVDLLLDPPLSTIRIPKVELGAEAIKLLIQMIKEKKKTKKKILVPVELIIRKSTSI